MKKSDMAFLVTSCTASAAASAAAITELRNYTTRACERFANNLETITKEMIDSKDRVDISLSEYERMQTQITDLRLENENLRSILKQIDFPFDLIDSIIPGTFETIWCDNPRDRQRKYSIEFSCRR